MEARKINIKLADKSLVPLGSAFSLLLALVFLTFWLLLSSCESSASVSNLSQDDNNTGARNPTANVEIPETDTPKPPTQTSEVRACVNVTSLRVRSGPGTEFAMVGGLANGSCVRIDGRNQDGSWVRISALNGNDIGSGWLAAAYLTFQGNEDELAPLREQQITSRPVEPAPTDTRWPTATTGAITPAISSGGLGGGSNCHPSYPTVCIPPPPPDLDCGHLSFGYFTVIGSDPHRFDGDNDGIGCE